jgi:hypothetical protein
LRARAIVMVANIKWGVWWGLRFAAFFTAIVLLEYIALGSAPFDHIGISPKAAIAAYFASGILAGAVVGALRPFTNTLYGSVGVGIVGAFVVAAAIVSVKSGPPNRWGFVEWATVVIGAVVYGVYLGSEWS